MRSSLTWATKMYQISNDVVGGAAGCEIIPGETLVNLCIVELMANLVSLFKLLNEG